MSATAEERHGRGDRDPDAGARTDAARRAREALHAMDMTDDEIDDLLIFLDHPRPVTRHDFGLGRWSWFLHVIPGFVLDLDPPDVEPRRAFVVWRPREWTRNVVAFALTGVR